MHTRVVHYYLVTSHQFCLQLFTMNKTCQCQSKPTPNKHVLFFNPLFTKFFILFLNIVVWKNDNHLLIHFHEIFVAFQIEENTKHIGESHIQSSASFGSDSRRRSSGWKVGARNALLQWCKEVITPKFGIHVDNFGASWRDGRAFVALISALNPGKQLLVLLLFQVFSVANFSKN